ncbi:anthranilate synthase component 1 [Spirochaetota bacterium]|nr:anthranilate synthase component 1 [Spirochaetota bacterium]
MFEDQILSLQQFLKQAALYDALTLQINTLSDYDTPTSLFKKLQASYLLESVDKGESVGRYSIIGAGERARLTFRGQKITLLEEKFAKNATFHEEVITAYNNPLHVIRDYFLSLKTMHPDNKKGTHQASPFLGGLLGYLGYETVSYFEAIPIGSDVLGVPDGILVFPRLVAVYDTVLRELVIATTVLIRRRRTDCKWIASEGHQAHQFQATSSVHAGTKVSVNSMTDRSTKTNSNNNADIQANFEKIPKHCLPELYEEARTLLINALHSIKKTPHISLYDFTPPISPVNPDPATELKSHVSRKDNSTPSNLDYKSTPTTAYFHKTTDSFTANMDDKQYEANVLKLIDYIRNGEMIQAVLSKRYSLAVRTEGFELYRSLKALNPSPFLYYLNFGDFEIAGSSPEVMVRLYGDDLLVRPIAGSIRRGRDPTEDEILAQKLLNDPKECAEHLMLVDLGRNDLARVAKAGSVRVKNYMTVEKYSQIQHIVSTVTAKKRSECDVLDIIAATFPAGTLSGAPKVRAMELIASLEHDKRGPYSGMLLNLGFNGNLDSCICIRSFVVFKEALHVQVGSGIVLDSIPLKEHHECKQKVAALMKAYTLTRARMLAAMK